MIEKRGNPVFRVLVLFAAVTLMASPAFCGEGGYTRFHVAGEGSVDLNLGPTGIWGYGPRTQKREVGPNFFVVKRVEAGSPANGLIKRFDVITGANGKSFPKGEDPRFYLANAMVDSEAKDGKLQLHVTRGGKAIKVVVELEPVPDYSPTWPHNCERTNTMLANACEYLAREQMPRGEVVADDGYIGPTQAGLLWLAMGEPQYLENARRAAYWFIDAARHDKLGGKLAWTYGYGGMLLAEYYEMTGDKNILPGLEFVAARIAKGQMPSGGWSHGFYSGYGAGYGEVNCAGMVCYMTLLLAKECGVKVDRVALRKAIRYYDKFAPTLTNQYGDHKWGSNKLGYGGQNGKIGGLAVAHRLNNRPIESAGYALKASRSASGIEGGHTGHFFNFLWTTIGASQAPAKDYRQTMDQIGWYYTLSRTWRGGLFCQPVGGSKYSTEGGQNMTTGGFGLSLVVARHRLRILGAPKSVFVQKLPAELEAARKLHQANKWDEAIAAVDAFLKKGGHDKKTTWLANDLRDKSRYVKESMVLTFKKLEELGVGSRLSVRAFKVEKMLKPLKILLGEDHPFLVKIEEGLPEKWRGIWTHGKDYYEAFSSLRSLSIYNWFIFAKLLEKAQVDVSIPADAPIWTDLATSPTGKGDWKRLCVSSPDKAPKGWLKLDFDDGNWTKATVKKRWPKGGYNLVRIPFEFDKKKYKVKQLSIALDKGAGFAAGAEVYLNGEKILSTMSGFGFRSRIDLMKNVPKLLRQGKNIVTYITANNHKKRIVPPFKLQAELRVASTFAWTPIPGRDAEFLKLVAQRRTPEPYYKADQDNRTVKELMQVFTAEPFFMPEAYNALQRFNKVLPKFADRASHIKALLNSKSWGARWVGVYMVCQAISVDSKQLRRLPKAEQPKAKAAIAANLAMAKQFIPQVVKLLNDPHRQVRCQAATAAGVFGASAKAGIPALNKLLNDVEGQDWFVRGEALKALNHMPVEDVLEAAITRTGLKDPNTTVRSTILGVTFRSRDEAVKKKSVQKYKKELIDQIFDAPHGMWTKGTRSQMAKLVLQELSKEEIRPYLPRFFTSLNRPSGHQLMGSMAIIASFGNEVRPKLEALAKGKDLTIRYNALETLQMIALQNGRPPELVKLLKRELTPLMDSEDLQRASWAKKLVKALDAEPGEMTTKKKKGRR